MGYQTDALFGLLFLAFVLLGDHHVPHLFVTVGLPIGTAGGSPCMRSIDSVKRAVLTSLEGVVTLSIQLFCT